MNTKKQKAKTNKTKTLPWETDPASLFEEISIDDPHSDRDLACAETRANWPEGWWAVSDFNDGYIAYFANEADACAYKLMLIGAIRNGGEIARRYTERERT